MSVRTALEARSDGRVDGVLRLERGGVRALYAGRRSAEGELLHRIGVATPPAILGPVSPKGLLAFALDPTGLPGGPPGEVITTPLSPVLDPSPATPFGVAVRAGADLAVFRDGHGTTAGAGIAVPRRRGGPVGGAVLLAASWPPPASGGDSWFPDEPAFRGIELFHAASALTLGGDRLEAALAAVGSAGAALRPGVAAAAALRWSGRVSAYGEVSYVGADYTVPDGAAGVPAGSAGRDALRFSGELAAGRLERTGTFTLEGEIRALGVRPRGGRTPANRSPETGRPPEGGSRVGRVAAEPPRAGPWETLAWTDRDASLTWKRRAARPGGVERNLFAGMEHDEESPGGRRTTLEAGLSRRSPRETFEIGAGTEATIEWLPPAAADSPSVRDSPALDAVKELSLALSPEIHYRPWAAHGNDLAFVLRSGVELKLPVGSDSASQGDEPLLDDMNVAVGMERRDIALRLELESRGDPVVPLFTSFREHYRVTVTFRLARNVPVPAPRRRNADPPAPGSR